MRKLASLCVLWALVTTGVLFAAEIRDNVPPMPSVPDTILRASYRITYHISYITMFDPDNRKKAEVHGTGTGTDEHHVLTASHVVSILDVPQFVLKPSIDDILIDIYDADGVFSRSITAKVAKIDAHVDLALLKTDDALPYFHKLDYGAYKTGRWAYIVGAGHGYSPTNVYWGMLASRKTEQPDLANKDAKVSLSEMSCTAAPGCSGGGVYTYDGKFLGVLTRGEDVCIALFVPADDVKSFLK